MTRWGLRIGLTFDQLDWHTPAEIAALLEAWEWAQQRDWERTAWIAYHSVSPWLGKNSKAVPADFIPGGHRGEVAMTEPTKALTRGEARTELESLIQEMGACENPGTTP